MEQATLTSRQYNKALSVLQREQHANGPTPFEELCFWLFGVSVFLVVLIHFVSILTGRYAPFLIDWIDLKWVELTLYWAYWFFALLSFVLLYLNAKLIGKLCHQARLRRQLGLAGFLEATFKQYRRRGMLGNLLLVLLVAYFVAYSITPMVELQLSDSLSDALLRLAYLVPLLTPIPTLVIIYFMRRGRERLKAAVELQQSLSKHHDTFSLDPDGEISIPSTDYERIARLERNQIIDARNRSVRRAHKERHKKSYVIQKSHKMLDTVKQLDPATRNHVEDRVLELLCEPRPHEAQPCADSDYLQLRIPETELSLHYQVDEADRRIRIYELLEGSPNVSQMWRGPRQ